MNILVGNVVTESSEGTSEREGVRVKSIVVVVGTMKISEEEVRREVSGGCAVSVVLGKSVKEEGVKILSESVSSEVGIGIKMLVVVGRTVKTGADVMEKTGNEVKSSEIEELEIAKEGDTTDKVDVGVRTSTLEGMLNEKDGVVLSITCTTVLETSKTMLDITDITGREVSG